ncbi:MAG TPA: zinc ribbon domain-containing protein, partial [Steroidobacteraceae bacterium]
MPFYEYECQSCKFYSEVMQKITDPPLKKCPSCGKNTMKKLISAPNFRLKGAGWYETDFKSEQETKRNLAEAEKAEKEAKAPESTEKPAEGAKPAEAAKAAEAKPSEAKSAAQAGRAGRRGAAVSGRSAASASGSSRGAQSARG